MFCIAEIASCFPVNPAAVQLRKEVHDTSACPGPVQFIGGCFAGDLFGISNNTAVCREKEAVFMIIDAHAHVYEYVRPYGPNGEGRAIGKGRVRWPDGKETPFFPERYGDYGFLPETLLGLMDEAGIEKAVLLQAPNYGFQNDFICETVRTYPDRFVGACAFDPYAGRALELFRHFTEVCKFHILKFEISEFWGLTGIHPDLSLDAPVFDAVWDHAQQTDTVVTIDTGVRNSGNWRLYPIARIKRRFPKLRFVIAHVLFPGDDGYDTTRLEMLSEIADGNVFFDISNTISRPEPYPYLRHQNFLRDLCSRVGADHMMWGTDIPSVLFNHTCCELLNYLRDGGLFSGEELEWILGNTAKEAYRIP